MADWKVRFDDWLKNSGHLARPCPFCGKAAWTKGWPVALRDAEWDDNHSCWDANAGGFQPAVALECSGCRLILTFALAGVDISAP